MTVASIRPVLISPRKAGTNVTATLVSLGMEKHVLVSCSKIFQLVKQFTVVKKNNERQ